MSLVTGDISSDTLIPIVDVCTGTGSSFDLSPLYYYIHVLKRRTESI